MTTETGSTTGASLTLERNYDFPPSAIFKAWTDPKNLSRWFMPSDGFSVEVIALNVRNGGDYRIEFHAPDGSVHKVHGVYMTVVPDTKLVFTWVWDGNDGEKAETLVTVAIAGRDTGSSLTLTHDRLSSDESRTSHTEGWTGILDRLAPYLNT